jgi:hypothetical protein
VKPDDETTEFLLGRVLRLAEALLITEEDQTSVETDEDEEQSE